MSLPTWLPWADRQDWGRRGPRFGNYPIKLVLHTTEGSSWPSYSAGAVQPHLTLGPWRGKGRGFAGLRQHQPLNVGARALVDNPAWPVNSMATIQVEMIGSCDKAYADHYGLMFMPGLGDDYLADLGAFVVKLASVIGCPLRVAPRWDGRYGTNAPQRMGLAQFRGFSGVCGHEHVYGNAHFDPGTVNVPRAVLLAAKGAAVVDDGVLTVGDVGAAVLALQHRLCDTYGARIACDGVFGPATAAAVRHAQGLLRVAVDGAWGPDSRAADAKYVAAEPVSTPMRAPSAPSRSKPRKPATRGLGLKVDGIVGPATASALSRAMGTHPDGTISSQSSAQRSRLPHWTAAQFVAPASARGSQAIAALQRKVGVKDDGLLGPATNRAIQHWLSKHRHAGLKADGVLGLRSNRALQRALNDSAL